jgi:heme-degrading monooxygenase HmoA
MRRRIAWFGIAAALLVGISARAGELPAEGRDSALTAQPDASASPEVRAKSKRMVARIWHGRTLTAKADDYEKYLQASAVKKIKATQGNHGVEVLRRADGAQTDFIVISYWESMEVIQRFAGPNYQTAVILPRDSEYLVDVEPQVAHYEVVSAGAR